MKHILLFESFRNKELVSYKGEKGKVVGIDGDNLKINLFKSKKTIEISENDTDLVRLKRCMGQCDKRIIEVDGDRQIKCFGCDRILTKKKGGN